ncbi:hypothetical protein A1Q1_00337 [Trichosporon asahii var. asahii CBS 2479]|uniref:Dynein light intermediate chain n=1 Tax=Trichosporon asahii var. asahii (strain ATCC 90039 / CBS 2479 / JCM 2466 / KCTC 7840 / NBRC 103889/ NCYC 2677 / UAMH 7654) TaxID=1186058 RepID=J4UG42_TRIAS|nr:hypothetical protein A1Q1_00337 [Trichosporon asahii var. asahii CBS 2479]EJT50405.1 hypothetical protein A1Q1_00337 [Trichosporon asahii var. asahii CBS 2479]
MQASGLLTPRPSRVPSGSGARTPTAAGPSSNPADSVDLWEDILRSADRAKTHAHKNIVLLAERHRGRTHLLDKLAGKRRQRPEGASALAIGYQVLESEDRDEALPPNPLPDTAVVIVLDWTKPSSMVRELLTWLSWVDGWAQRVSKDTDEMRDRLQAHLQHYTEPPAPGTPAPTKALGTTLLPLGPGTLTLNPAGVPIIVVCTRADQMDSVGDEMGMKGGSWEERTDWIQQVLRTICLSYGAALFYTSQTQPQTYTLLRDYLVHRLYTTPGASGEPVARYPFAHRANVLDRDAVLVPAGWDSWGKINVLREGFDLQRVHNAWESSINRFGQSTDADEEAIDDLWTAMVPDTERPKNRNDGAITTTSEGEQAFLAKQLEALMKDPNRDPRASFRHAVNSAAANEGEAPQRFGGVVGPMGAGGLNLPGVEKAMAEMEGGDDVKERFARIARRQEGKPQSPPNERPAVPNEALHNFFQGLLAKKSGGTPTQTPTKSK